MLAMFFRNVLYVSVFATKISYTVSLSEHSVVGFFCAGNGGTLIRLSMDGLEKFSWKSSRASAEQESCRRNAVLHKAHSSIENFICKCSGVLGQFYDGFDDSLEHITEFSCAHLFQGILESGLDGIQSRPVITNDLNHFDLFVLIA